MHIRENAKKTLKIVVGILPVVAAIIFVICFLRTEEGFSVDVLLSRMPHNTALAVIVLLLIYALKSLSVIFPLLVLYIFLLFW